MASSLASPDGRFRVTRVQLNIIARRERQLLNWLCARLPSWVTPDRLTILSVLGACLTLTGYVASRFEPAGLWLASVGLVVNWFGDSLDGSLARHRRLERPIYGYFLDHTVDALCNLMIMGGIGLTLHVRMDVALFALVGYYLLCMYVFINNHLSGVFQLSFLGLGPTELRLGLIAINIGMFYCGHFGLALGGQFFTGYDALLLLAAVAFIAIFIIKMIVGIRELRDPLRSGALPHAEPAAKS